jgi:glycosyltransferase 2 family protein
MRWLRAALAAGGAVLFGYLVIEIGPRDIAGSIAALSWRLLVIVVFPFVVVNAFDTLGWFFAFRRNVPFGTLLWVRMAGEAFNATTPTGSIGGEPVKAWLLRPRIPLRESLASVIVAKTTITIAQGLFLVVGIVCALWRLEDDSLLLRLMVATLGLEVLAVGGFVVAQLGGLFGRSGRLLERFGVTGDVGGRAGRRLDGALAVFYRRQPKRLALSIAFHFLGWAASGLETYLILTLLGTPVSALTAIVIEAVGTAVRFATFLVPAHLGALEGGYVATFPLLGLDPSTALSFSLVRRIREAAWVGVGFLFLPTIGREA